MLVIKKIRADHVIDFAAEELKKYLRMMMPHVGDITIAYDLEAKDGFRLGLLDDFGITAEAHDPDWDDIVHIETDYGHVNPGAGSGRVFTLETMNM